MTRAIATAAALLALAPFTPAQILVHPTKSPSATTADVDLVDVLSSVRDKRGALIKNLAKADFALKVDGRRQEITHFASEVDSPLTVALLFDVSGSVANIIGAEKVAAGRFFAEVLRPNDRALLAGFAQDVAVWQDLTPPGADLQEALGKVRPFGRASGPNRKARPRGGTLLFDAVALVAGQKLQKRPGRKTIVLITDGEDNGSRVNLEAARKAALEADAIIYGIHYDDPLVGPQTTRSGMRTLEQLAAPTGGRAYDVSRKTTLEAIFAAIGEEMRNQYGLEFTPPGGGNVGIFHRVEVSVKKDGLKVQARDGFYR